VLAHLHHGLDGGELGDVGEDLLTMRLCSILEILIERQVSRAIIW
jgi:hypothetical protein